MPAGTGGRDCPGLKERDCGTWSSTMTPTPLGETGTVGHLLLCKQQVPIDVTAASLSQFPFSSWVVWNNLGEVELVETATTLKGLYWVSHFQPFYWQADILATTYETVFQYHSGWAKRQCTSPSGLSSHRWHHRSAQHVRSYQLIMSPAA